MPFDLPTFFKRSGTSVLFVAVLLTSVTFCIYSLAALVLTLIIIGLFEFYNISKHMGAAPYKGLGYTLSVLIFALFFLFLLNDIFRLMQLGYIFCLISILSIFIFAIFDKTQQVFQNVSFTILSILYVTLPFCTFLLLVDYHYAFLGPSEATYDYSYLLAIIFYIWINDTGAYLVGSLFGKHKILPRISPGKTWEGCIGGLIFTILSAFLMEYLFGKSSITAWMLLALIASVTGTLGDLVESMFKRLAGIKDSGNLLPGHGGVLDRFDSLIFAVPFVYLVLPLVKLYA